MNQLGLPSMAQAFAELEAAGEAETFSHADCAWPLAYAMPGCAIRRLSKT
jgi:hypothetical protein